MSDGDNGTPERQGRFAWEWLPDEPDSVDDASKEAASVPPAAPSIDYVALLEKQIEEAERRGRDRERLRRVRALAVPLATRRKLPLDVGRETGTSSPISARLPRWLDEQLRREFERLEVSPSVALRQILEEWWVQRRYPALEFRSTAFLRLAALRGGPAVAEWAGSDPRPELGPAELEQTLEYIELFRSRVDAELGTGS
ncbi:MAG TPA: hypothetical protein VMN78_05175 [Longimicrobiales bacterium]|nr:hypothetical protein [Longimicrobiales bacterium]